ncbi:MAG: hypothetical protein KGS72_18920 [Cyanobacteria bacterium REEB67]|nr:hypothetical protein [Cyanobacteria bacterium REEB67]
MPSQMASLIVFEDARIDPCCYSYYGLETDIAFDFVILPGPAGALLN